MSVLKQICQNELKHFISHPYYIINCILASAFMIVRKLDPVCHFLFSAHNGDADSDCELDMRETEILFFVAVIIMIKARKHGMTTAVSYISSGFIYAKLANVILFFRSDPRYGLLYSLLFVLQCILLPEPTYKGPEFITYFRANGLADELSRDPKCTWMVTFFTTWSPMANKFAPVFAKLSAAYHVDKRLRFGKIDIGRYPDVAELYSIDTSTLSSEIPTVILFQSGTEQGRVPPPKSEASTKDRKQSSRLLLKELDVVKIFGLDDIYAKCKVKSNNVPNKKEL